MSKIFNRDVVVAGDIYVQNGSTKTKVITSAGVVAVNATTVTNLTATGNTALGDAVTDTLTIKGATSIQSTSASALAVGANGATNPVLKVDASTSSVATGLSLKGAAAAGGMAVAVISSGTNENLTIDAKGSGTITLAGTSTGAVAISRNTSVTGTLTVGVDDTGHDVQFYGATASANLLWDESADTLKLQGAAGFMEDATTLTANSDSGAASSIPAGKRAAVVTGVTADANDWIVLPAIASVPIGHTIRIACNASSNFELRTPASSTTTINNVNSDGTQEYLCTDTDVVVVTKHTATGWIAQSLTNLGAVRTAVVPD